MMIVYLLCLLFSGPILFVKKFSYKDVQRATDGFHRIVYSNSHGAAYKAKFEGGEVALVKEAKAFDEGKERKESFYREVQFLGRLHHRHLLALRGFSTGHKRLTSNFCFVSVFRFSCF